MLNTTKQKKHKQFLWYIPIREGIQIFDVDQYITDYKNGHQAVIVILRKKAKIMQCQDAQL